MSGCYEIKAMCDDCGKEITTQAFLCKLFGLEDAVCLRNAVTGKPINGDCKPNKSSGPKENLE